MSSSQRNSGVQTKVQSCRTILGRHGKGSFPSGMRSPVPSHLVMTPSIASINAQLARGADLIINFVSEKPLFPRTRRRCFKSSRARQRKKAPVSPAPFLVILGRSIVEIVGKYSSTNKSHFSSLSLNASQPDTPIQKLRTRYSIPGLSNTTATVDPFVNFGGSDYCGSRSFFLSLSVFLSKSLQNWLSQPETQL